MLLGDTNQVFLNTTFKYIKFLNYHMKKILNKTIILRTDIDVPLKNNRITDDSRLQAMLPTIKQLLKNKNKIVIIGHMGRPKGKKIKNLQTDVIAKRLSKLLKRPVFKVNTCYGEELKTFIDSMCPKDIVVLENLRFWKEEKLNNAKFAKDIAKLGDYYINDCFSTSHRKHASIVGILKYLPHTLGLNVEKEIKGLKQALNPKKPYIAILGAAKISDKIKLIDELCKKVDKIILGGAVVFTFFKALGYEVGKSLVDDSKINDCKKLLKKYKKKIILPVDVVIAKNLNAKSKTVAVHAMPKTYAGYDIGKLSIELFKIHLKNAKTIFWNGPLGVFENAKFAKGTKKIATFLAKSKAITILGGGDTGAAISKYKLKDKFTYVSTAGGASIEFIEGKTLPGLK